MKLTGIIAVSIVTAAATPAAAAEWWYAAQSTDDTVTFVDAATVVRAGDVVQIWMYSIKRDVKNGVKSIMGRSKRWCSLRRFQSGSEIQYGADGSVVGSLPPSSPGPIKDVAPDSIADALNELACSPVSTWAAKGAVKVRPGETPESLADLAHTETPPE